MKAAAAALIAAAALGAVGATVAHAVLRRSAPPALPLLHGEVTWAPGSRPAPLSLPRGRTAVLAFVAPGCAGCLAELRLAVESVPARLRPTIVRHAFHGHSLILIVDRSGDVRTGYSFPFAPAFVTDDLEALAR